MWLLLIAELIMYFSNEIYWTHWIVVYMMEGSEEAGSGQLWDQLKNTARRKIRNCRSSFQMTILRKARLRCLSQQLQLCHTNTPQQGSFPHISHWKCWSSLRIVTLKIQLMVEKLWSGDYFKETSTIRKWLWRHTVNARERKGDGSRNALWS